MLTVGVLALQGAVQEHLDRLNSLPGVTGVAVKKATEFATIDGLILPGGESTAIGKLLLQYRLTQTIVDKVRSGLPVWGTCAGMILLAKSIVGESTCHLGLMDITVQRNSYGSQLDSFMTNLLVPSVSATPIPLVFIRAPHIAGATAGVRVLATVDDKIVAVEQDNMLATAFHPELTDNLAFHRYFVEKLTGNPSSPS